MRQRVSLGDTVLQLEDYPDQNLNPKTASSIHQLSPSGLPLLPIQTVCVEKKHSPEYQRDQQGSEWDVSQTHDGLWSHVLCHLQDGCFGSQGCRPWCPPVQLAEPCCRGGAAGRGALHPSGSLQGEKRLRKKIPTNKEKSCLRRLRCSWLTTKSIPVDDAGERKES